MLLLIMGSCVHTHTHTHTHISTHAVQISTKVNVTRVIYIHIPRTINYAYMWIGSRVKVMYIPYRICIRYTYVYVYIYICATFSCVICMCKIKSLNRSVKETKLEIIMGQMGLAMRSRVISMWKNGYRLSKIRTHFVEEGVAVSKKLLCQNMRKYRLTGSVADHCTYKQPKKLP